MALENNTSLETRNAAAQGEPWCGLLAGAAPRDHIVQLYQDQQFLNRAVCRFAAAAIANGEGVILVPTVAHWDAFRPAFYSRTGPGMEAVEEMEPLKYFAGERMNENLRRSGCKHIPPNAPAWRAGGIHKARENWGD